MALSLRIAGVFIGRFLLGPFLISTTALGAGAQSHTSSFTGTTIDLGAMEWFQQDLRQVADMIHQKLGARVLRWDPRGEVVEFSRGGTATAEEPVFTAADRAALSKDFRAVFASSANNALGSTLSAITLSPFETLSMGQQRKLEAETLIVLGEMQPAVLRHELLHLLFNLAAPPALHRVDGRTVSHLEFLQTELRSWEALYETAPSLATKRGMDDALWRLVQFSVARELEVMEVELRMGREFDLSAADVTNRALYFSTQMEKIAGLAQTPDSQALLKAGWAVLKKYDLDSVPAQFGITLPVFDDETNRKK